MERALSPEEVIYKFKTNNIVRNYGEFTLPQYIDVYSKIKTSIEVDRDGYNMYLIGEFPKERVKHIISYVKNILKNEEAPKDICYVIKDNSKEPIPIILNSGMGIKLKEELLSLQKLYDDLSFEFYNNLDNEEKDSLINNIQQNRNKLVSDLIEVSKKYGFDIKNSDNGFAFIPLNNETEMTEEEYENLEEEEKNRLNIKVSELKHKAKNIFAQLKSIESEEVKKIKNILELYFGEKIVEKSEELKEIFKKDKLALDYLLYVLNTIKNNLIDNYSINYEDDEEKINDIIYKYNINVLVDNSKNNTPPVIFEEDPNMTALFGSIEYENHNNMYVSKLSSLKAGSFIKANGGCLILRANSLLSNGQSYNNLKKALLTKKVDLDYNKGYFEFLSLGGLRPEPINVNTKVILIGDYETYDILYNLDKDFKNLFKIRGEYRNILSIDESTTSILQMQIEEFIIHNNIKPVTESGIKEIAKVLSRKAENRNKLYFDDDELFDLLILANCKAVEENKEFIDGKDIDDVFFKQEIIEDEFLKLYSEKKVFIDIDGVKVGKINGLSVINTGYTSFGKPIRITCTCSKGEGRILDVQREANLSGKIHTKAISILKGYISTLNGGYSKLPVDFYLSFEQLYSKVDGDSASVAEVICIISSITKIPIRQNIAVTGSINQFGEVQPIGGVNEKIEGFYKICKEFQSIKGKGVIIPSSNKDDLVLCSEIEDAVLQGDFTVYVIDSIEDAMKLLLDYEDLSLEKIIAIIKNECEKYSKE